MAVANLGVALWGVADGNWVVLFSKLLLGITCATCAGVEYADHS